MSLVVTRPLPQPPTSSNDSDPFWQVRTDGVDDVGISSYIIGSLFDALMGCIKAVLDHTRQSRPEPPHYWSLEKSAAALLFWGSDHGVSHGNLDRALKHSRLLRDTVLLVLTSIGDLLSQKFLKSLSVEACSYLLKASNITFLMEAAKSALEEPDDLCTHGTDIEQDEEELCTVLQEKIESLERLNTSLECPARGYCDGTKLDAGAIVQETHNRSERDMSKRSPVTKNVELESNSGLIFITGSVPADLKSQKHMTTVRKKAMDAFLKGGARLSRKQKPVDSKSRFSSVNSDSGWSKRSESSLGSWHTTTDLSSISTTVSKISEDVGRTTIHSSTLDLTGSHHQGQDTSDVSRMGTQRPNNFVLPPAPMFYRCRDDVPNPYDTYEPPPFISIGKSLDPFQKPLQSAFPGASLEELKFHGVRYFGTRALGRYWMPTALSYPHTFLSTLCVTTAFHDIMHERLLESVQTIALRQEVIHLVGRNMLDPDARVSDHNIMAIIQLIVSEVIGSRISELDWHENGIETMIKERGGLEKLGVDGHLASSISWVSLAISVLREALPRTLYADYCVANSTRQYEATKTLPESPIFSPRRLWTTIPKSPKCTPRAQELLADMRTMIDLFVHESSHRNPQIFMDLYEKITSLTKYPSIEEVKSSRLLTQHDYQYEAIRIASIIQAEAIVRRVPLSDALTYAAEGWITPGLHSSLSTPVSTDDKVPGMVASDISAAPSLSIHVASPTVSQSCLVEKSPRPSLSSLNPSGSHLPLGSSEKRPSLSFTRSSPSDYDIFPLPPNSAPSNTTALLKNLRSTIECSNISGCWSEMAGVLLWISLVFGAASRKCESRIYKRYFSALTMRVGVILCFEHPEAINNTMVKMCEVVKALAIREQRRPGDHEGKAKNRRT